MILDGDTADHPVSERVFQGAVQIVAAFDGRPELAHIGNTEGARQPMSHDGQSIKGRDAVRFLLTNRTLLANYWAYFVYGYFLFFFMTWLPSYLSGKFGYTLTQSALWTAVTVLGMACGIWVFGQFAEQSVGAEVGDVMAQTGEPLGQLVLE